MSGKTIVLPEAQMMFLRLLAVADDQQLQRSFYPKLVRYAGTTQTAEDIVRILRTAIEEYAGTRRKVRVKLTIYFLRLLEALVVDQQVACEACSIYMKPKQRELEH